MEGIDGCLEPEGERQREREREGEACRCFLGEEMGVFWSLGFSVFSMRWNITACNLVLSSPACILAQPPTPHGSFCLLWTVPLGGRKDADPETRALAWLGMWFPCCQRQMWHLDDVCLLWTRTGWALRDTCNSDSISASLTRPWALGRSIDSTCSPCVPTIQHSAWHTVGA